MLKESLKIWLPQLQAALGVGSDSVEPSSSGGVLIVMEKFFFTNFGFENDFILFFEFRNVLWTSMRDFPARNCSSKPNCMKIVNRFWTLLLRRMTKVSKLGTFLVGYGICKAKITRKKLLHIWIKQKKYH